MADTQESYPLPTNGIGKALFVKLSGKQVTNANPEQSSGALVGGNNTYKVTLSVANSNATTGVYGTVAVTASLYDLAGTFQSIAGSVTAISYNFLPTAAGSGTQESYPVPNATVGAVASVGSVTYSGSVASAVITPLNPGQAVCEFEYPFAGNSEGLIGGSLPLQNDMVYAQILVTVVP
jgi:hypothetical protein